MIDDQPNPPRLRDDPAFRSETGCDLADETLAVGGYDLTRGRARLLAAIATLPPPGGGAAPSPPAPTTPAAPAPAATSGATAAVVSTLVAAVVTVAVWFATPAAEVPAPRQAPPAAVVAPADGPVARAPEAPSVPTADPVLPAVAPLVRAPALVVPADPPVAATGPVEVLPTADPVAVVAVPVVAAPTQAAPSALQADYEAFLAGDSRLKESDWRGARSGFEAYLRDFPHGAMEPEARFGLLVALFELGDARSAETQARLIQDRPEFSSRRPEILRLRAESLVLLDRCEEALSLADALASKDAAEVRRVCRARRREVP